MRYQPRTVVPPTRTQMSCRRPVEHRRSEIRSSRPLIGPRGTKPCHVTAPANIDSGCAAAAFLSFRCVVGGQEGSGVRVRHTVRTPDHIARDTTSLAEIPEYRCRFALDVHKNNTKSSLSLFLNTIARVISIYSFSLFFFCSIFFKVFLKFFFRKDPILDDFRLWRSFVNSGIKTIILISSFILRSTNFRFTGII